MIAYSSAPTHGAVRFTCQPSDTMPPLTGPKTSLLHVVRQAFHTARTDYWLTQSEITAAQSELAALRAEEDTLPQGDDSDEGEAIEIRIATSERLEAQSRARARAAETTTAYLAAASALVREHGHLRNALRGAAALDRVEALLARVDDAARMTERTATTRAIRATTPAVLDLVERVVVPALVALKAAA